MACGCKQKSMSQRVAEMSSAEATAAAAASQTYHEVWKDDTYTGRRFSSLLSARRYADTIGGEVRASS